MLIIDGAQGEGGGQILRTALALSICLDKAFRMVNIRGRRRRPGLHTLTNMAVIEAFMSTRIDQKQISQRGWQLTFVP